MIPSFGQLRNTFKDGAGFLKDLENVGFVQGPLAYAGRPLGDVKQVYYGDQLDQKKQGEKKEKTHKDNVWDFLRKHVFTYGIVASIAASVVSFFTGKVALGSAEGSPLKKLGFVSGILGTFSLASIVASVFSSARKIPSKYFINIYDRARLEGKKILDMVLNKRMKADPIASRDDSPLRYPKYVEDRLNFIGMFSDYGSAKKAFLIGPTRTGKTSLVEYVVGRIKDYELKLSENERREVVDYVVSGQELIEVVSGKDPNSTAFKKISSVLGADLLTDILESGNPGAEMLTTLGAGLSDAYAKAKEEKKRLIINFDDLHVIAELARDPQTKQLNTDVLTQLFNSFADMADNPEIDIFFTSNKNIDSILEIQRTVIDPATGKPVITEKSGDAERVFGRLFGKIALVDLPDDETKVKIMGVYIRHAVESGKNSDQALKELVDQAKLSRKGDSTIDIDSIVGESVVKNITNKLEESILAEQYPKVWAEQLADSICEQFPGVKDVTQRDKIIKSAMGNLKIQLTQKVAFETIAGGFIQEIIVRNLVEKGREISIDSITDAILSHQPDDSQKAGIDLKVRDHERRLLDEITKKIQENVLETTNIAKLERILGSKSGEGGIDEVKELKVRFDQLGGQNEKDIRNKVINDPDGRKVYQDIRSFFRQEDLLKSTEGHLKEDASNLLSLLEASIAKVTGQVNVNVSESLERENLHSELLQLVEGLEDDPLINAVKDEKSYDVMVAQLREVNTQKANALVAKLIKARIASSAAAS